jgi:hypothetical protein
MRSRVRFVDLSEVSKHAAAQSFIYLDPPRSSLVPVDTCFTCSCACILEYAPFTAGTPV